MSAQHTPGQWIFDPKNTGRSYDIETGIYAELPNGKIKSVANVPCTTADDDNADTIERTANARLIAAAPELLAELTEAVDALATDIAADCRWCDGEGTWDESGREPRMVPVQHKPDCIIVKARAAIAKATGGDP